MSTSTFCQGDRVAERGRPADYVFTSKSPGYEQAKQLAGRRRTGQVVAVKQKTSAKGSRITYVDVLWDGRRSPSTHAACRLIRITAA